MAKYLTHCKNCGAEIESESVPEICKCGSPELFVKISTSDSLTADLEELVKLISNDPLASKKKRLRRELIQGDTTSGSEKEKSWKRRLIDKDNDIYEERIIRKDGTTIHYTKEPLSKHRGHGSARDPKNKS